MSDRNEVQLSTVTLGLTLFPVGLAIMLSSPSWLTETYLLIAIIAGGLVFLTGIAFLFIAVSRTKKTDKELAAEIRRQNQFKFAEIHAVISTLSAELDKKKYFLSVATAYNDEL